MSEKKSLILYADLIHVVKKLPLEAAGELFKIILSFANGEEAEITNPLVEIAFEPIKQQILRDKEKWDKVKSARSKAGSKSADSRSSKQLAQNEQLSTSTNTSEQISTKSTNVEFVEQNEHNPTNPTVNVNANANVNGNVNVNVSKLLTEQEVFELMKLEAPPDTDVGLIQNEAAAFCRKYKSNSVKDLQALIRSWASRTNWKRNGFKPIQRDTARPGTILEPC